MSHHFDSQLAKQNPSVNVCDFYLFDGAPGTTVMAMTVNPSNPSDRRAVPSVLDAEGLYAFRFDLDDDAREDVTFKVRFGVVQHARNDERNDESVHVQRFQVRRAAGEAALWGAGGALVIEGKTGTVQTAADVRFYAGPAPDLFAGDAAALHAFLQAFYRERRYDPAAFVDRRNVCAVGNVTAIVLEVPTAMIGRGRVRAWSTAALYGHAPETQVSRWGLPLITHLFLNDPDRQDLKEQFNRSTPSADHACFGTPIAAMTETMTTLARSVDSPSEYGREVAHRLCPTTLPFELGTRAAFEADRFNGRALVDDVTDVMLSLVSHEALADGIAPDPSRIRGDFPYFGEPYP
jgi:hypothetical protein